MTPPALRSLTKNWPCMEEAYGGTKQMHVRAVTLYSGPVEEVTHGYTTAP